MPAGETETRTEAPAEISATPAVTVIVVSYNTRALTLEALRSLLAETDMAALEVIVVDNASADGSADAIAAEFPLLKLLALADNIGFARANNLAAKMARGKYLLLLNPDTVVLERAVDRLVAFARAHPQARIWGGRTLFADRTLNPASCWGRMTPWSLFCLASGLKALFPRTGFMDPEGMPDWKRDSIRHVDIVSGCFLLIERALWEELDGFDSSYFMYGEDADLCLRGKRLGAEPLICPDAAIVHYGGASEPVRADKMIRLLKARVTLMRDHWPSWLRPLGTLLYRLFPLPRMAGYRLAAAIRSKPSDRSQFETWRSIWRARRDWLAGYDRSERR
ncbi:glycosyltransferase family 2 protein [Parvibaculum sp.]|uniref:glycosyltransferase family 2 protein n=1 Tax=Parvibaculum sp. TaxID=2024848 RepID=UPI001B085C41|nr:glycosyltransferase family 2 protein [Parvibaculum sp.]MBO6679270.1 glycosyltransferase family 2 protein [Parvibaculum sp.]MBO6685413.1 glycosyltransferase family 2 protein [Parvibaculum sp.]